MSRYARGKEPKCPVKLPGCLGVIADRSAKQCANCYKTAKSMGAGVGADAIPRDTIVATSKGQEITKHVNQEILNDEDLVRVCKIDLERWRIERWVCNTWGMGYTDTKKQAHVQPIFQVKAWLVPRTEIIVAKNEIRQLLEDAKKRMPRVTVMRRAPESRDDLSLVIEVPDLHAGKMAWAKETGHANYDVKIAVQEYRNAIEKIIERASNHRFAEVVLPIGNDMFNADNTQNTTTHGTPQDTDGRYQKTFLIVRRMLCEEIEKLASVAPVKVITVSGNHDQLAAWHLGDSLECWFHGRRDVTVDNAPTLRKYHQFGQVMLMFTHGNKGKKADYPLVMATEEKVRWGNSTHREIHTGHLHKSMLDEFHGVKVRVSPALCPPDAWHSENQFVGNTRAAEGYIYDRNEGLTNIVYYTVPEEKK